MKLAAVRLFVHDIERAHRFYGGMLAWPLHADGRRDGHVVYRLGEVDVVVEAVPPDAAEDEQSLVGRPTGLSLGVDDIQARCQALAGRGVRFGGAPTRQPWGGWLADFEDPDGNGLQLVQYPGPPARP